MGSLRGDINLSGTSHLSPNFVSLLFYLLVQSLPDAVRLLNVLNEFVLNESANFLIFGSLLEIKSNLSTISFISRMTPLMMPFTDADYHTVLFVSFRARCTLLLLQR